MKEKNSKASGKKNAGLCSVRIRITSKERAAALLLACNKKKSGRKVKLDELFEVAISQVADEQVKLLQERSLTNEDRKEILRQKYIEVRGPISKDAFTGLCGRPHKPVNVALAVMWPR
jgi:hypothetical protein